MQRGDMDDGPAREASVHRLLEAQFDAYEDTTRPATRLLDFGCGAGASTLFLASRFPDAEIIGVELDPALVATGNASLTARRITRARLLASPGPTQLPPDIGQFDIVVLSAVVEHLLPDERRALLPLLWSVLRPSGRLYISQTPYRWFPYEHHSTGLWGINYLPDRLAHWCAARWARIYREANATRDWPGHLRGGLRGSTEWEVLRCLRLAQDRRPLVMRPRHGSRARYWIAQTSPRHRTIKRAVAAIFGLTDRLFGTVPSMNLDLVVRKDA